MQKEEILVSALTAGGGAATVSGFRRVQSTRGHSFSCCLSLPRSHCSEPPLEEGRHPHAVMGYQAGKAEPFQIFGGLSKWHQGAYSRFHLSSGNTELRQMFNTKVRSERGLTGVGDYLSHSLRYEAVSSEGLNWITAHLSRLERSLR